MFVKDFEDLAIYQKSRAIAKQVYQITKSGDFKYDTRFVQQIRASSGSISDNIAEGFERQGTKEFKNFLFIAKGSCGELRSQINRALDAEWIDETTHHQMYDDCKKLAISINKFILSLKSSDYKGSRYTETPITTNQDNSSPIKTTQSSNDLKEQITYLIGMERQSGSMDAISPLYVSRMLNVPLEDVEKAMREMGV